MRRKPGARSPRRFVSPANQKPGKTSAAQVLNETVRFWRHQFLEPTVLFIFVLLFTVAAAPLFHSFFIGEDMWRGMQHPDSETLRQIFLPTSLFWRPFIGVLFLLSAKLLPLNPFVYHLRNYAATLACGVLLYLILRHLVQSQFARLSAMALFVFSKVHLTTIGCIEMVDSIVTLFNVLACLYAMILFFDTGRRVFWGAAVTFFLFAVCSRDYSVALIAVVALLLFDYLKLQTSEGSWKTFLRLLTPFVIIVAVYICVRVVGIKSSRIPSSGNYALGVHPEQLLQHANLFAADVFNLTLVRPYIHGSGSLLELIHAPSYSTVAYLGTAVLLFLVTAATHWRDLKVWTFLALTVLFIVPTFLVVLAHTYYILTPLAGLAVVLGLSLDGNHRWNMILRPAWIIVLLVTAGNGFLMEQNWKSLWWATAAAEVRRTYDEVLLNETDPRLKQLTLLVPTKETQGYLQWALNPFHGPGLVQELTHNQNVQLSVDVFHPESPLPASETSAVYVDDHGHFRKVGALRIDSGGPFHVKVGERFNVQPAGQSAIWLGTRNAPSSAIVKMGSTVLTSVYGGPSTMSADIPSAILQKAGTYPLWIEDPTTGMKSNAVQFSIEK